MDFINASSAMQRFEELPLAHLQLSKRAYNRCLEEGFSTVADVLRSHSEGRVGPERLGAGSSEEVCEAVAALRRHADSPAGCNWAAFLNERPFQYHVLAVAYEEFDRLDPKVREQNLGILNLGKACKKLENGHISTIGDLIVAFRQGIEGLKGFGRQSVDEVIDSLRCLASVIEENGSVDWTRYARCRGIKMLPANPAERYDGPLLARELPALAKEVIQHQFNEREWDVFQKRFLAPESQRPILEELGQRYGVTRERIRQIEENCIEAIARPLFFDDYRGLDFRFRDELVAIFHETADHFSELGLPAWRQSVWREELGRMWSLDEAGLAPLLRLVVALFGYESRHFESLPIEAIVFNRTTPEAEKNQIHRWVGSLHEVLLNHHQGIDAVGIADAIGKKINQKVPVDAVPMLIELCSSAEAISEDLYRTAFRMLPSRSEMIYRLFVENGMPLHREDILKKLNQRLPPEKQLENVASVTHHLTGDPRIKPIGKSGEWTLPEWGHDVRPIISIIEEVLINADEVLTTDTILERVSAVREAAPASVNLMLSTHPERFWKVAPKTFGLVKWRERADEFEVWNQDSVSRFVEDYFQKLGRNEVLFSDLKNQLVRESGMSPRSAQGILNTNPAIRVVELNSRLRNAIFRPEWRTQRIRKRNPDRPLQADRIVETVSGYMRAAQKSEMNLVDAVRRVEKDLNVGKPSIYAAIRQSDELETIAVDGSVFRICRFRGMSVSTYPQVDRLSNSNWRSQCHSAIQKITPDDVDIGLFQLGRQFDQAMDQLLTAAAASGRHVVSDGHKKTLQNRIDWAFSNGIFNDKSTLHLLKTDRNERGHQPPTAEERAAILKFAPFLVELYLDYLLMIDKRIQAFESPVNHHVP